MPTKTTSNRHHSGSLATLLLCLSFGLTAASSSATATTLYKCKLGGKVVYSDTDCSREVRIKNPPKPTKPHVIKIRRKTTANKTA